MSLYFKVNNVSDVRNIPAGGDQRYCSRQQTKKPHLRRRVLTEEKNGEAFFSRGGGRYQPVYSVRTVYDVVRKPREGGVLCFKSRKDGRVWPSGLFFPTSERIETLAGFLFRTCDLLTAAGWCFLFNAVCGWSLVVLSAKSSKTQFSFSSPDARLPAAFFPYGGRVAYAMVRGTLGYL